MGREIRRVPPNWEHPKNDEDGYIPLYKTNYHKTMKEWIEGYLLWEKGEHPDQQNDSYEPDDEYQEWHGSPPRIDSHVKYTKEEATWYQAYETVSEGTPVSPPFEKQQELVEYLVENGDFWDQNRRARGGTPGGMPCDPWPREQAEKFVYGSGWAPTGIVENGEFKLGYEALRAPESPIEKAKQT